MILKLIRVEESDECTRGILLVDGIIECYTLELPYKDNIRNISCIPPGVYRCERTHSKKFGDVIQVLDVENRTHILFHIGNISSDTHGCILPGSLFGHLAGHKAVLNSRSAMEQLIEKVENEKTFGLEIITVI